MARRLGCSSAGGSQEATSNTAAAFNLVRGWIPLRRQDRCPRAEALWCCGPMASRD